MMKDTSNNNDADKNKGYHDNEMVKEVDVERFDDDEEGEDYDEEDYEEEDLIDSASLPYDDATKNNHTAKNSKNIKREYYKSSDAYYQNPLSSSPSYEALLSKRLYSDAALNLLVSCEQRKKIKLEPPPQAQPNMKKPVGIGGGSSSSTVQQQEEVPSSSSTSSTTRVVNRTNTTATTITNTNQIELLDPNTPFEKDEDLMILKFPPVIPLPSKRIIGSVFADQIIPALLNQLQQQQQQHHHHHSNPQRGTIKVGTKNPTKTTDSKKKIKINNNTQVEKKNNISNNKNNQKEETGDDKTEKIASTIIADHDTTQYFSYSSNTMKTTKMILDSHQNNNNNNKTDPWMHTNKQRVCNCKRSNCLKLYCDCFAAGVFCHFNENEQENNSYNNDEDEGGGGDGNSSTNYPRSSKKSTPSSTTTLKRAQAWLMNNNNGISSGSTSTFPSCGCVSCKNIPSPIITSTTTVDENTLYLALSDPEKDRRDAILTILERNPNAFRPRAQVLAGYATSASSAMNAGMSGMGSSSGGDMGLLLPPEGGGSKSSLFSSSAKTNTSMLYNNNNTTNHSDVPLQQQQSTRVFEWPQALGLASSSTTTQRPMNYNPSYPQTKGLSGCNCKKSFCLKKYCECYQAFMLCNTQICRCTNCKNIEGNPERDKALNTKPKLPNAQPPQPTSVTITAPTPAIAPAIAKTTTGTKPIMAHVSRLPLPPLTASKLNEIIAMDFKKAAELKINTNNNNENNNNDNNNKESSSSESDTMKGAISETTTLISKPSTTTPGGLIRNLEIDKNDNNNDDDDKNDNDEDETQTDATTNLDTDVYNTITYAEFPIPSFPVSTDPMAVLYSVVSTAVKATNTARSNKDKMESKLNVETDPFLPPSSFTIPLSSGVLAFGKSSTRTTTTGACGDNKSFNNTYQELEKKWIRAKERLEVHIHDIQHILSNNEGNNMKKMEVVKKRNDGEGKTKSSTVGSVTPTTTSSAAASSTLSSEQVPLAPTFARAMVDGISRDMTHVCDLMDGTEQRFREWLRRYNNSNSATIKDTTRNKESSNKMTCNDDRELADTIDDLQCTEEMPWISSSDQSDINSSSELEEQLVTAAQEATLLFEMARIIRRKAFQLARERNDKH